MALRNLAFSKPQLIYNANKIISRTVTNLGLSEASNSSSGPRETNKKPIVRGKVLIDGVKLYWEKFGNGPQIAFLLPGLVGSLHDNFVPITKKMDLEKYTLIGWDPPGYGKSRPPDREVFMEEHCLAKDARLASLLMQELGYDTYSTIGWSNGGSTGALIAAAFPERVEKVVMCNSPLQFNDRSKKIMKLMVDIDTWTLSQRKALLRCYGKTYAIKMLTDWKKYVEDEADSQIFSTYFAAEMRKIRAPTLYIKSMQDVAVPMEDALGYESLIPNLKLHKVSKGGHDLLEFANEFVSATDNFLSS